jgi:hypothetical protein
MVPHSRLHRTRQSANIMGDCCMRRHREWGTVTAVVGNSRHDVSADVVGLLWVVSCVGIHGVVYQTISDASPMRWGRASPPASELSARQPPCRMDHCATFANSVHHGGLMRCGFGVKEGGTGAERDYSHSMQSCASIDDGGRRRPTAATVGPHSRLLGIQQSTSILCDRTTSLKLMLFSYSKA